MPSPGALSGPTRRRTRRRWSTRRSGLPAAEAARRLAGAPTRRVVGAADLDSDAVAEADDPDDPGQVRLGAPVALRALVSLHVDEEPGSDDELQWYDVTELQSVRVRCG